MSTWLLLVLLVGCSVVLCFFIFGLNFNFALYSDVALLSVSNKTGLTDLARGLSNAGVRLVASGGTAKMLRENGMTVEYVGEEKYITK